jgi:hypothetical protein
MPDQQEAVYWYCIVLPDSSDETRVWVRDSYLSEDMANRVKKPGDKVYKGLRRARPGQLLILPGGTTWRDL